MYPCLANQYIYASGTLRKSTECTECISNRYGLEFGDRAYNLMHGSDHADRGPQTASEFSSCD